MSEEPRKIDLYESATVGRVGEVVVLRGNEDASGGGRLVRVALDPEALDISIGTAPNRLERLVALLDAGRLEFLPQNTLAVVEGFGTTPAARSCAQLGVSSLSARHASAWCLMHEDGPALPPPWPPIVPALANCAPELRLLRQRHRRFYDRAELDEAAMLDQAAVATGSLEIIVGVLRDGFERENRRQHELHAHAAEVQLVDLRNRIERSPAFLSLTPAERAAIRRDVFDVDFEKDPLR